MDGKIDVRMGEWMTNGWMNGCSTCALKLLRLLGKGGLSKYGSGSLISGWSG